MASKLDVEIAAAILRKYRKAAMDRKNEAAQKEVEKIMTVLGELFEMVKGELKDE